MAETTQNQVTRLWTMRGGFVAVGIAVILVNLMPLETVPRAWAGPDLLLALCCVWTIRRPDYAPALAVAFLMLMADLMYQRPPGLMAALVVLATEWLKARARTMRDLPFPAEWVAAAGVITAVLLGYRLVLALFLVDQAPLMLSLIQLAATLVAYPVVVVFSSVVLGLRKTAPGEVDNLGHRL